MTTLIVFLILSAAAFVLSWMTASNAQSFTRSARWLAVGGLAALVTGVIVYPYANIWERELSGKAQLAEAEANRQIIVREAQAKYDAAELLANAEIRRARGVAEANQIVANGLGGPEGYLRYLYIESMTNTSNQIIYVPTEAGLPILEANRLRATQGAK